jgi:hypothetical protein
MKKIFTLLLIVLVSYSVNAQQRGQGKQDLKPLEKIEQLEKAKLIEVLSLKEETAVRLFARRNEMQKKIKEIFDKREEIIKEIDENFKKGAHESDAALKDKINSLLSLDGSIIKEKKNFYRSLEDILTTAQIAKLMVFETKFRREIRESLMHGKGPNN